jgi:hypothetical protein
MEIAPGQCVCRRCFALKGWDHLTPGCSCTADALYLGVEAADLVLTCSPALAGVTTDIFVPVDVDLSGPALSAAPPPGGSSSGGALLSAWQVGYIRDALVSAWHVGSRYPLELAMIMATYTMSDYADDTWYLLGR